MEPKEILELVRAGFTKQDIALMIAPVAADPAEPAAPAAVPAAAAEPVPAAEPAAPAAAPAAPAAQPEPEPQQPSTADLMKEIAKLTSAIQANAIANSKLPAGIGQPVKAEDVMAEIIRPTRRKGKE